MKVKYVCSLGWNCHTASFLKRNRIKFVSYPFDWIFIDYFNIIDCLHDNFRKFLNKDYYIDRGNACGHSLYQPYMFNHHNPLKKDDYEYFKRSIDRFNKLLTYDDDSKLFIMTYPNLNYLDEHLKYRITHYFHTEFSKYANNHTLLLIFNLSKKNERYFNFTYWENFHFLEIHTTSDSDGIEFENKEDTEYFDTVVKNIYDFDLKPMV